VDILEQITTIGTVKSTCSLFKDSANGGVYITSIPESDIASILESYAGCWHSWHHQQTAGVIDRNEEQLWNEATWKGEWDESWGKDSDPYFTI